MRGVHTPLSVVECTPYIVVERVAPTRSAGVPRPLQHISEGHVAYKGKTVVSTESFLSIARDLGASVEVTSGYLVITKPGTPDKQVLVEKFVKKGTTTSVSRWVELRGKGKTPFVSSSPGVVDHIHSSPSIAKRLDTDADEATIISTFRLLIAELMGVELKVEEPVAEEA